MNYKKIATALATGAILLQTSLPTFAATELIISGNGADSDNDVVVSQTNTTTVTQTNNTDVDNNINISTNTGGNTAEDNTGGDVFVKTGDADATVVVVNNLNSNVANVENCGDCAGDSLVLIEGNGAGSDNDARLRDYEVTKVWQDNVADVDNDVDVVLKTGDNLAEDNTGGSVAIVTGDANANVGVSTFANSNTAMIAGADGEGGGVALVIVGNGADSDNDIVLGLKRANVVTQWNTTDIDNDVDVKVATGHNAIDDSTGGDSGIKTGDANMTVVVDNMAGFNHAYIDDCCFEDVLAKISGNGAGDEDASRNTIRAFLDQNLSVFQDNSCGMDWGWPMPMYGDQSFLRGGDMPMMWWPWDNDCFDNDLDLHAYTGGNLVDDSTGEPGTDPLIITGDSDVVVGVENIGGSNTYGDYSPPMGDHYDGASFDFEFSFSFEALFAALLG